MRTTASHGRGFLCMYFEYHPPITQPNRRNIKGRLSFDDVVNVDRERDDGAAVRLSWMAVFLAATALAGTSSAYKISLSSKDTYPGTQKTFSTSGTHSVGFTVKSWIWSTAGGDGCCIAFKGSTVHD